MVTSIEPDRSASVNGAPLESISPELAAKYAAYRRTNAPLGRRASTIKPERIEWLWPKRIARGKLHVIDGDPGLGKTFITHDLAARISAGIHAPDGTFLTTGNVLLLSAEDGPSDTIVPRLKAAGAKLNRIRIIDTIRIGAQSDLPQLPHDIERIERTAQECNAVLIVIDPLMAYLPSSINAHRDQDVRRVLFALAEMARRTTAAVVVVRHLNKSEDTSNPLYRGGGSIGIIGAARVGLFVAKDPDDQERRIFALTKNNLGPMAPALSFSIKSTNGAARVKWHGESAHTADDLLASTERLHKPRDNAKDFLIKLLADGSVLQSEVERRAEREGITSRTLRRAKKALGVRSEKDKTKVGKWWWSLPKPSAPDARGVEECQPD